MGVSVLPWPNVARCELNICDEWVDDAVHEVFLVATRRLEEFQGRSSLRTWLFAITFRVGARMRRDRVRRQVRTANYVKEQPEPIADAARESEAAQYLRHLLQKLNEQQRVVLILAELEGFTSQEITAHSAVLWHLEFADESAATQPKDAAERRRELLGRAQRVHEDGDVECTVR
jgi:RNA polymerase sigma-70 factor, ECF subfamily